MPIYSLTELDIFSKLQFFIKFRKPLYSSEGLLKSPINPNIQRTEIVKKEPIFEHPVFQFYLKDSDGTHVRNAECQVIRPTKYKCVYDEHTGAYKCPGASSYDQYEVSIQPSTLHYNFKKENVKNGENIRLTPYQRIQVTFKGKPNLEGVKFQYKIRNFELQEMIVGVDNKAFFKCPLSPNKNEIFEISLVNGKELGLIPNQSFPLEIVEDKAKQIKLETAYRPFNIIDWRTWLPKALGILLIFILVLALGFLVCQNITSQTTTSGSTPSGSTPSETTPSETTPSETTPSGSTPSETTPSETTPSGTTPSETTPSGTTPSGRTTSETTTSGFKSVDDTFENCDLTIEYKQYILSEIRSTNFDDFSNKIEVKVNYLKKCENVFVEDNKDIIEDYRIASIAVWNCEDHFKRMKNITPDISEACGDLYDLSELEVYNQEQSVYMFKLWEKWANRQQ